MLTKESQIAVRYAEVDRMGIAHHANYPIWFEVGRTEFFERIGFSYTEIENSGILMPLMKMECNFLKPVHYEDKILLLTRLAELTRVKASFEYEIKIQNDVVTTGRTIHAWTNRQLKPVNLAKMNPRLFQLLTPNALE